MNRKDPHIRYVPIQDTDSELRSIRIYDSYHHQAAATTSTTENDSVGNTSTTSLHLNDDRPLVLLGGTAQTILTFTPHMRNLSKSRRLLIPELRCQGKTELLSANSTVKQHVQDIEKLLVALDIPDKVDIVGFSFGGRVALALAAHTPHLVARISVTGVPLTRPALGNLILQSWSESLPSEFRSCAWSFVLNGYSPRFLERFHERLPTFVDMVMESNDPIKLASLMKCSHVTDDADAYSVASCAKLVTCPVQVIGATEDRISGFSAVKQLSDIIKTSVFEQMETGHLAPFEDPLHWRKMVLEYLQRS
jgi:pimeloyl-ACP methyl ester carboxylesterase